MNGPLVVSTRREPSDGPFARTLHRAGLRVWSVPTTRVAAISDPTLPARLCDGLARAGWIAFTSPQAAKRLWSIGAVREWWRTSKLRPRIAAIGPATAAAIRCHGPTVDLVAPTATGRGLAEALLDLSTEASAEADLSTEASAEADLSTEASAEADLSAEASAKADRVIAARLHVLWPRAERVEPTFGETLSGRGAALEPIALYRSIGVRPAELPRLLRALEAGDVAAVCFSSPSAAEALASACGGDLAAVDRTLVASFGATTSAALRRLGLAPGVEAERADRQVFADAIVRGLATRVPWPAAIGSEA